MGVAPRYFQGSRNEMVDRVQQMTTIDLSDLLPRRQDGHFETKEHDKTITMKGGLENEH